MSIHGVGAIARNPHQRLAKLMDAKLGVTVDPDALRIFVNTYWDHISVLAHSMHDLNPMDMSIDASPPREFGGPPK